MTFLVGNLKVQMTSFSGLDKSFCNGHIVVSLVEVVVIIVVLVCKRLFGGFELFDGVFECLSTIAEPNSNNFAIVVQFLGNISHLSPWIGYDR